MAFLEKLAKLAIPIGAAASLLQYSIYDGKYLLLLLFILYQLNNII